MRILLNNIFHMQVLTISFYFLHNIKDTINIIYNIIIRIRILYILE